MPWMPRLRAGAVRPPALAADFVQRAPPEVTHPAELLIQLGPEVLQANQVIPGVRHPASSLSDNITQTRPVTSDKAKPPTFVSHTLVLSRHAENVGGRYYYRISSLNSSDDPVTERR